MITSKRLLAVAVSTALYAPLSAFATNGMNMEGYGPIATGMGGASMAYDNGTAAMANNVATLGMMNDGNRIDAVVGILQPNVHSEAYNQDSKSTQFLMPAAGWAQKNGNWAYGAGVFAQGGMGTEYDTPGMPGLKDRSQLGVGRFIIPVAYNVNNALTVGGSLDYVWASLDMQMTAPASQLGPMVTGGTMASLIGTTPGLLAGRFDFNSGSNFTGAAKGEGFAGKLGMTYKFTPTLSFGLNYQSKTALGDLETGTNGATMTVFTTGGAQTMTGKVTVKDFQWPEMFAAGLSWQASDALMVVADVKQIQWANVMKDFKMTFTANSSFGGGTLDVTLPQNWKDQTVFQLGAAYKFTPAFTGRIGANLASNPIPDSYVNPLFPAIIENHYTLGAGYAFNKAQDVNFSYVYAPEVKVNSPSGQITHSQSNWQLMYSHRF